MAHKTTRESTALMKTLVNKIFYLCRSNPYEGQRRSKDRCGGVGAKVSPMLATTRIFSEHMGSLFYPTDPKAYADAAKACNNRAPAGWLDSSNKSGSKHVQNIIQKQGLLQIYLQAVLWAH